MRINLYPLFTNITLTKKQQFTTIRQNNLQTSSTFYNINYLALQQQREMCVFVEENGNCKNGKTVKGTRKSKKLKLNRFVRNKCFLKIHQKQWNSFMAPQPQPS